VNDLRIEGDGGMVMKTDMQMACKSAKAYFARKKDGRF
jgi:hypothetical protein